MFFFSSRRRHTRLQGDWSSDVCSSDLQARRRTSEPLADDEELRRVVRDEDPVDVAERVGAQNPSVWRDGDELVVAWREIGRASCRERVEIVVAAGGLNSTRSMSGCDDT